MFCQRVVFRPHDLVEGRYVYDHVELVRHVFYGVSRFVVGLVYDLFVGSVLCAS